MIYVNKNNLGGRIIVINKTMQGFLDFVENCTKAGIYNINTGSSRATAIKKFIGALDIASQDINDIDVDDLVNRYANKFPWKLKSASLKVYKMRLTKFIEDFKRYGESPADFKLQRNKSKQDAKRDLAIASQNDKTNNTLPDDTLSSNDAVSELEGVRDSSLQNVEHHATNPTMRLRLRPNVEISISGIPVDLTPAEGRKINALINVFTISDSGEVG